MAVYNVSKIESWYNDFSSLRNKYINDNYKSYNNSYIKKCGNSSIIKMRNNLNSHYERIKKLYNGVNNYWRDYLNDVKNTDNRLAGKGGSIKVSSLLSKLESMPHLQEYNDTVVDKVIKTVSDTFYEYSSKIADFYKETCATIAVAVTSVISGGFRIGEGIMDGLIWCVGTVTSLLVGLFDKETSENIQKNIMNFISYDVVGEVNKEFYENTSIGKTINDYSSLKYDSKVANDIQNVSEKVFEVALATIVTVATGGTAAPIAASILLGTGFLYGAGQKAEEKYKESRDFYAEAGNIVISGLIKSIEFYSEGQMGAGALKAVRAVKSSGGVINFIKGIKTVLTNGDSKLFTKDILKQGIKTTFKDVDTYIDSAGAAFNNISYDENGFHIDWSGLAKETACNFALNSVFSIVGNIFEARMASGMKNIEIGLKSPDINSNSFQSITFSNAKSPNVNSNSFQSIAFSPVKSINQTNFQNMVDQDLKELTDDYNYLLSLRDNGTLKKLIRQGQRFDGRTGVKLTDVDSALKKYEKRIYGLADLVVKDDLVMTSRQRILYDALNDSIEKLNKQFGANYGPDIGIRNVMAYANRRVGLDYIPMEYRNVIKDYSYDELHEYFLFKNKIEICNEFSKNGKMTDNYTKTFSKYVDANKIEETKNVNIFLTEKAFDIFSPLPRAMGFNNGKNSYMNIKYADDIIKSVISHENIHQMSSNRGISGIHINEVHRGINETFTEYLNSLCLKSDYPSCNCCAYQPMVDRLKLLVRKGVFTDDDIMSAYFNNDISQIKNKVNQLANSNRYYDKFVMAFKNAHDNQIYTDLDKCCSDLGYWNSKKNITNKFFRYFRLI